MANRKHDEIEIRELTSEELDKVQGGFSLFKSISLSTSFTPSYSFDLSRDVYSGSFADDCGTDDSGAMGCPG